MPTCQGQHPDRSPCRNRTPAGETHCYIHRDGGGHLQPYQVQEAIVENGGSEGLDLSCEDLAGIALNNQRLSGVVLRGATLTEANLSGADLTRADLASARLDHADLRSANLVMANLQDTRLWQANLAEAELDEADLRGAHLRWARLEKVDLGVARTLDGAFFYGAFLDKTRMRREQLGEKIGDELVAETGRAGSYNQAREAYLALKSNFNELGRYDDASWAYRRERRMERAMSSWRRAAKEFAEEKQWLEKKRPWLGRPSFYIRRGREWLWDGLVELVTDYGERPGRVLGWAVLLLLVVYPFIYWWCAGRPAPAGDLPAFAKDYLLLSLGAFSTLDVVNLSAAGTWTRLWAASEAMAGISLLALLMFTLGNRISRS